MKQTASAPGGPSPVAGTAPVHGPSRSSDQVADAEFCDHFPSDIIYWTKNVDSRQVDGVESRSYTDTETDEDTDPGSGGQSGNDSGGHSGNDSESAMVSPDHETLPDEFESSDDVDSNDPY